MTTGDLRIVCDTRIDLDEYARIPIAFEVTERLDLRSGDRALVASTLPALAIVPPYRKDYDVEPGQHPPQWPQRFDLTHWWFAAAFVGERRIGGAVVIPGPSSSDTAILWDIRVHPGYRSRGVGRALLAWAESHARSAGQGHMQIETQDINLPACRLYAAAGYALTAINRGAYPTLPDEIQLLWDRKLIT